jgi:hypothetical protein
LESGKIDRVSGNDEAAAAKSFRQGRPACLNAKAITRKAPKRDTQEQTENNRDHKGMRD